MHSTVAAKGVGGDIACAMAGLALITQQCYRLLREAHMLYVDVNDLANDVDTHLDTSYLAKFPVASRNFSVHFALP